MLNMIRSWIGQLLDGQMDARMEKSLASFVAGIIEGKSLVASEIGRHIPSEAYEKHKIKQADRFLGNAGFDDSVLSRALLRYFGFVAFQRVVLTLDWTKLGKSCWLMTTSVVMGGRALPFQWTVVNEKHTRIAVGQKWHVDKLVAMLPKNVCFVLLFDAGYDGGEFIKYLAGLPLKFIVRSSTSACIRPINEDKWLNLKTFSLLRGRVQDWGQVEFTKSHSVPVRFIGLHDPGQEDAWLLITNLEDEGRLVATLYGRRFETEETYKDYKDIRAGFQLKGTRIQNPRRLERLIAAQTVAYHLLVLLGLYGEHNLLHLRMQANTVKSRRVLALWRVGRNLLRKKWVIRCLNLVGLLKAHLETLSVSLGGKPCQASG